MNIVALFIIKKRWCSDIISLLKGMKLWPSPLFFMFVFSYILTCCHGENKVPSFSPCFIVYVITIPLQSPQILFLHFHLHIGWSIIYCCNNSSQGVGHSVYNQLYYAWQFNIANPTIRCQKKTKINDDSHL